MVDEDEQQDGNEEYLRVSDVAKVFDVTSYTVRQWLNNGDLKGVKIGNGHYWRVAKSEIKRYADKRYQPGEAHD